MFNCRCRKCCMQNNCNNNDFSTIFNNDNVEENDMNDRNSFECGFNDTNNNSMFPKNAVFGQSYVPIQKLDKTFIPSVGLKKGTLFPELYMPYSPYQSMEEIAFIKAMNNIKERDAINVR